MGQDLDPGLVKQLEPLHNALWKSRNAVVPLVGSGMSQGLKSWKELLESLIAELPEADRDDAQELLDKDKYLDLAACLEAHQAVGRNRILTRIEQLYKQPNIPRPDVYDQLVALPTDHFLTTNYDPWLKHALAKRMGGAPRVYAPKDPEGFAETEACSSPLVLMIHGDADRSGTCVLSSWDYRRLSHGNSAFKLGMQQLVGQRRLLLVGYSVSDPDILALLDEWQVVFAPDGGATRHFMLDAQTKPARRSLLRRRGIESIDVGDFGRLGDVLQYLATPPPGVARAVSDPADGALSAYLQGLWDQTRSIDIQGIATRHGVGKSALSYPIEELYTPLRTAFGAMQEHGEGPLEMREELRTLSDVLPGQKHLLIEGQPGSGKTTFLRLVASLLARDALGCTGAGGKCFSEEHLGLAADEPSRIPLFVRAAALVPLLTKLPVGTAADRGQLSAFLEALCCRNGQTIPKEHFAKLLEAGRAFLLLDGVDEIADLTLRPRLFEILADAVRYFPGRILVSSRPFDTEALCAMGFARARVEPFGRSEIEQYVARWVSGLRASDGMGMSAAGIEAHQRDVTATILNNPQIRSLAENPVMLTCLCVVHFNAGRLPEARSRLYEAVVDWLLRAKAEKRKELGREGELDYNEEFTRRALARLAYGMMTTDQGKRSILGFGEAVQLLTEDLARQFPKVSSDCLQPIGESWLSFECETSGIIEELPGRQLRFWHLTFQEYLAALWMSWQVSRSSSWFTDHVARHLEDPQWRETMDVLPGVLYDGPGQDAVDKLLAKVVELDSGDLRLPGRARMAALLSRLLRPLEIYQYRNPGIAKVWRDALDASMAIFTPKGAEELPVQYRIEVADALGRAGDPRLAPGVDNFLPVPGTNIALGKYPVTVEEYRLFVEDRGYEQRKYWSDEGWARRQGESWLGPEDWESQLLQPNWPVVGVSVYEAEAYCAWKAEKCGRTLRLPSEIEWSAAATSPRGDYPWGAKEPDEELCNFGINVGHPTPVGVYPSGAGPFGHLDLAGNVWEWTGTDVDGGRFRVFRGGSWFNRARGCRSAYRFRFVPGGRRFNLGFRLAAVQ